MFAKIGVSAGYSKIATTAAKEKAAHKLQKQVIENRANPKKVNGLSEGETKFCVKHAGRIKFM